MSRIRNCINWFYGFSGSSLKRDSKEEDALSQWASVAVIFSEVVISGHVIRENRV